MRVDHSWSGKVVRNDNNDDNNDLVPTTATAAPTASSLSMTLLASFSREER